jgi:hypothetical protein
MPLNKGFSQASNVPLDWNNGGGGGGGGFGSGGPDGLQDKYTNPYPWPNTTWPQWFQNQVANSGWGNNANRTPLTNWRI